jgi:hypothetical protein
MDLQFEPISLEKQQAYLDKLAQSKQVSSDYSFSNIFGWGDEYGLTWAFNEHLVWIKQEKPRPSYWAPIGDWENTDWQKVFRDRHCVLTRVPEKLSVIWQDLLPGRLKIEEVRNHWDYLYDINELIELKGKRFHKKKNLLNQFLKKYEYRYIDFGPELIEPAMAMQADWCSWRDCESSDVLAAENRSVLKILTNWDKLFGLTGGAIVVEDIIVAYTIGEKITDDTVVIHYEKGCPDFKGVYQAINQMFLANSARDFKYVNREQDLGEEGLRKAKLSYNPVDLLKKYRVSVV